MVGHPDRERPWLKPAAASGSPEQFSNSRTLNNIETVDLFADPAVQTATAPEPNCRNFDLTVHLAPDSIEGAAKLMKNARFLPVSMQN
jgi:hypothetical protein